MPRNSETPVKPRLRAYKACENCRIRKVRCTGESPCQACVEAGIVNYCFVRAKAKPSRLLSARILERDTAESSESSAIPSNPLADPPPASFRFDYNYTAGPINLDISPQASFSDESVVQLSASSINPDHTSPLPTGGSEAVTRAPLQVSEAILSEWCIANDVPLVHLLFHDEARLANAIAPPLPLGQARAQFEDGLMQSLISAEDLDRLAILNIHKLLNLYSRYRALPESLTEDQSAFVYSSFCVARHTQLREGVAGGLKEPTTTAREDVTYYRMARLSLAAWGRASITSIWALFCLSLYLQLHGGMAEHKEVLVLLGHQIRALGLHQRSTAQLYPAEDMAGHILSMYCYVETLRAIMTDLQPSIPISDLELDPLVSVNGTDETMRRVAMEAVNYLRDYADPLVDVLAPSYIAKSEEIYSVNLDLLRSRRDRGFAKVRLGWVEMRIHWLRILLHCPRMQSTPGHANQATMYISRAVIHIINIHTEAASINMLDPSWLQLWRITACGQLLIVCCSRGEIHALEAADLFVRLIDLLEAHKETWPVVEQTIRGFRKASSRLGIDLSAVPKEITRVIAPEPAPFVPFGNEFDPNWFLDFDLEALNGDPNRGGA